MTEPTFEELLERSSLGTPESKAFQAMISDEEVAEIVARARAYEEQPECLLCLRPGVHRFSEVGGPDGWLCEKHKDDPLGGEGRRGRR